MNQPAVKIEEKEGIANGITNFASELSKYFMDFLETDFHKVKTPKRHIQIKNSDNLQVCIRVNNYNKFTSILWKVIRSGFKDDSLKEIKRGVFTNTIPKNLLGLIKEQIKDISQDQIDETIKHFKNEIDLALSKNAKDSTMALSAAIDGIERVIREKFLENFISKLEEPLEKLKAANVDSVYHVEEELTDILKKPFEELVSTIVNYQLLEKEINVEESLKQVFEIGDVKSKLEVFFNSFAVADLFYEISEIYNNKNLLDKQEFYVYFFDISFESKTYPLFYIPISLEKVDGGFSINFDSLLYVNKKAVKYISQSYNEALEKPNVPLTSFLDRIIYVAEKGDHLIGDIDSAVKEAINYFGLNPYIDIHNPEKQVAKGQSISISNGCYLGIFDKSDESLINDYEEILEKLKLGDNELASAFKVLVDDFITNNPKSFVSEVSDEWDDSECSEKLVCSSPIPLNEEQRQILSALKKNDCKYITVEGPPGTGKSHTITAIVCDAILKNQSVLVLSDKKEALDVVEENITKTMNKVRVDENFQNPILRLGRAGNTYAKILSTNSMEKIREHYKAVRSDYSNIEKAIGSSVTQLKSHISEDVDIHKNIKISEIANFNALEKEINQLKNAPIDIKEFIEKENSYKELEQLKSNLEQLKPLISNESYNLENLYTKVYKDHNFESFINFFIFLKIVEETKLKYPNAIAGLKKIEKINIESLNHLIDYYNECKKLKSGILGYFLKGAKLEALRKELNSKLSNSIENPHLELELISNVIQLFKGSLETKSAEEIKSKFKFDYDFVELLHQAIKLDLKFPEADKRKNIIDLINSTELLLEGYKKTAKKIGFSKDNITSYCKNGLIDCLEELYSKIINYLKIKNKIESSFNKLPKYQYLNDKRNIENLVTAQMTYKMDERVVKFYENYKNDAKTLASVISKKQKFDRNSFEKLKESFPCILAGIRDYAEYIPLDFGLFDIVIMDEASQVSIAQALPALLRGKKVIVLGDRKQFSNVKSNQARTETNREYLNRLRKVFVENISNEDVKLERLGKFNIKTSVLEFFERITNYNIMLKKHFRGYKELISYSSKYFYQDSLQAIKIRSKPIDQVIQFNLIEHDSRLETVENSNKLEIESIVQEVERINKESPKASIGIITPHTNQQKLLVDAFTRHIDFETFKKDNALKVMTFDTCQGEERDIIIYSMVANPASDKLWGIFIKDRNSVDIEGDGHIKMQRLNVGFSRAKEAMRFFISKPIDQFTGSIGEALMHYNKVLEDFKRMPDASQTDAKSGKEKEVLNWIQETLFFKNNIDHIELHAQFPLGEYLKQLDRRYNHPNYVVDFLLIYTDAERNEHKIILEYDGFEHHFENHDSVNQFNYDQYYTEQHIYREKVLESYGYKFIRLNRFNTNKNPALYLDKVFEELVKKKTKIAH